MAECLISRVFQRFDAALLQERGMKSGGNYSPLMDAAENWMVPEWPIPGLYTQPQVYLLGQTEQGALVLSDEGYLNQ